MQMHKHMQKQQQKNSNFELASENGNRIQQLKYLKC